MKYGSVVSGESDVVIDGFDVSEDTPDNKNDKWWDDANNWGGC
nr:hypothetical protein [uncultured Prevotella sp.]